MTWLEYFRTKFPLSTALLNSEAAKQFTPGIRGIVFSKVAAWANEEKLCWMWDEKEIEQSYNGLMKKTPEQIRAFCETANEPLEKHKAFIDSFLEKDLSEKSLAELKMILQQNLSLTFPVTGKFIMFIDVFDIHSEKDVKKIIREQCEKKLSEKELEKLFSQISTVDYTTYVILEEQDTFKAAQVIQQKTATIAEKAHELFHAYWWSELGWERKPVKSKGFFEEKLRETVKNYSPQQLEEKIHEIENAKTKAIQERKTVIQQYHLEKLVPLISLTDQLAKYHDYRKESQMKGNWLNYRIIDAISIKTGISTELLDNATFEELFSICNGKPVNIRELQERNKAYYYELNGKNETLLSGKKALEKIASIAQLPEFFGNFGGTIASKGVVTGKAKVCFGSGDALKKIEPGNILVTGMTTPDFVPAMKRAAAIITDEGGLTCHAAIIARELNIPCIVGTKIGTKVLKDNDWIEVNANHGIIKKIEGRK